MHIPEVFEFRCFPLHYLSAAPTAIAEHRRGTARVRNFSLPSWLFSHRPTFPSHPISAN